MERQLREGPEVLHLSMVDTRVVLPSGAGCSNPAYTAYSCWREASAVNGEVEALHGH